MNNGPVASSLIFLSDLRNVAAGRKVRFLGWFVHQRVSPALGRILISGSSVTNYSAASGVLSLQHNYPPQGTKVTALVDVRVIMESLKATDLRFGEWLNVIGYVPFPPSCEKTRNEKDFELNPQI